MTVEYEPRARDIAVIGMSGRFPGARDLDTFWQNLAQGRDGVTFFSDEEVAAAGVPPEEFKQPNYVKAGMVLDGVEEFDAAFFGYNPKEAEILDPQQRLFLEHAWEAIEHAGYSPQRYQQLIGIYAGIAWNTYLLSNLTAHADLFDSSNVFQTFITNDKDFMATRLSYKLNLKGPSVVVQTSCSTSLVAVHLACMGLLVYDCDMALAGGVTVKVPQKSGYMYLEGGLASPDGHCRSFDAQAQGTIFGSGIGVVVLKRLADAIEDGDTIHAVIRGSAINNDGAMKVSYTAPSVEGQAEVIAAAQSAADVEAETISYIETHGTGTALGDPIEVAALNKVFREQTEKTQFCGIGSVKSNIGHLDAAAGIAGLLKTVLAFKHGQIPPSLHFTAPNPKMDLANSPFYVNTRLADWPRSDVPRRAAVSSFGVGGTNAHVILEEAPPLAASGPGQPWHVLQISAKTATALERATAHLVAYLRQYPEVPLADIAYTLQVGRMVFGHRRIVVCQRHEDAAQALETLDPQRVWSDVDSQDPRDRPVVFMFPGQGAQYVGMGQALYRQESGFRSAVDECARLLKPQLGFDIRALLYPEIMPTGGPAATVDGALLEQTQYGQPALFVIEYALAQLWRSWGIEPQAMIGHSIGEYVAATLAGVFSLADALRLVATRGRLMQELPAGTMLSVALSEQDLLPLLGPDLSLAAVNAPNVCVVSGPVSAIATFEQRLTALSINYRTLHTSHAFHSSMMEPIVATFAAAVAQVPRQAPTLPYVSNVTGTWITDAEATNPQYWARHLRQTVRFAQGLDTLMAAEGAPAEHMLLEVGPGTTLSSLARQQYSCLAVASLRHPQDQRDDLAVILSGLGKLWLAGLNIDCNTFAEQQRRRVPLPTYSFDRQRYWIEAQPRLAARSRRVAPGKQADLADWFYLPSWQRTPLLKPLSAEDLAQRVQTWLLLIESYGIGAVLAQRLAALGQRVVTVEAGAAFARQTARQYTIAADQPEDYDRLLAELQRDGLFPQAIVHAWSITADGTDLRSAQEHGFFSLLFLTQSLGRQTEAGDLRIGILTSNMQHVAGEQRLAPEQAPILGLSKVIPQEYPQITCRSIDLVLPAQPPRPDLLDQWLAEIIADDAQSVVAYRDRQRWLETYQPVRLEPDPVPLYPLQHQGAYAITGGLAGLGLALARFLAQTINARLVLIEAAPLPARATWDAWLTVHEPGDSTSLKIQRVRELERQGAQVLLLHIDYERPEQWRAALDQARQAFGTVHGLIHAAGAEGEQSFQALQDTDRDSTLQHFREKVYGVAALADALVGQALDLCCLASSLSTVLGGRGSAVYTAANCFMDLLVYQQNQLGTTRWISVDWDVWASDEQNQIATFSNELARLAISQDEVGEVFTRIVTGNLSHVVVSTAELVGRIDEGRVRLQAMRGQLQQDLSMPTTRHPRPQLQTMYVAPSTDLEQSIAAVWQRVLGFEAIGVDDNFFDLGGDSLIAIRMVNHLKHDLGMDISVVKLYQAVTIRALVAVLEQSDHQSQQRSTQLQERREEMQRRKQYQQQRRARREH